MNDKNPKSFYHDPTHKLSTPSFHSEPSPPHYYSRESFLKEPISEKSKDFTNSIAVANCIRALNQKVSLLTSENQSLKKYNNDLLSEINDIKEKNSENDETRSIICSYKEKCIILEQSNDLFQKKLHKLEEVNSNYETLKSEMLLMNKELSKEIEKNKEFNLLNNQLQDEKLFLQNEIEHLTKTKSFKTSENNKENFGHTKKPGIYEEFKLKEIENQNRFLEEILEKQQHELDDKRKQIESLKQNIIGLEDELFTAKKNQIKNETYIRELNEMNERLLKALKKKNCRHRASTPDIMQGPSISRSHSGLFTSGIQK